MWRIELTSCINLVNGESPRGSWSKIPGSVDCDFLGVRGRVFWGSCWAGDEEGGSGFGRLAWFDLLMELLFLVVCCCSNIGALLSELRAPRRGQAFCRRVRWSERFERASWERARDI